jgi:hypothetical protein
MTYQGRIENLAKALEAVPIGGTITYGQITKALGGLPFPGPNGGENRHYIYPARRIARRSGCWFIVVPNEGYQRPENKEIVTSTPRAMKSIRRKADDNIKEVVAVLRHANDLANDIRIKSQKLVAVMGMVKHLSRPQTAEGLPDIVIKSGTKPGEQMRDTMERILGRKIED